MFRVILRDSTVLLEKTMFRSPYGGGVPAVGSIIYLNKLSASSAEKDEQIDVVRITEVIYDLGFFPDLDSVDVQHLTLVVERVLAPTLDG